MTLEEIEDLLERELRTLSLLTSTLELEHTPKERKALNKLADLANKSFCSLKELRESKIYSSEYSFPFEWEHDINALSHL